MIGATTLHGLLGRKEIRDANWGYLYNKYIPSNYPTNLINGLHAPSPSEFLTLITYLDGNDNAGKELKQIGTSGWLTPNSDALDSVNFSAVGNGTRDQYGAFVNKLYYGYYITSGSVTYKLAYDSSATISIISNDVSAHSIRCMRDLTTQEQIDYSDGEIVESKTDYDGNSYDVVRIGTQGWTTTNLKCTTYLNGTAIPNVTNNTTWAALTTGARCAYDNDENNV